MTRTAEMDRCIEACNACHEVCTETVSHCLEMGGKHAAADHIGLMLDCADICATDARFMMRGSAHHADVCAACAEVCDACAKSCDALGGDQHMQLCADQCRRCAELCRQMAGSRAH